MASLARLIYWGIRDAAEHGDSPLPADILTDDPEQTLKNLACYLDPFKDTIRHPNWNHFHPERAHEPDIL
jgi:hypothetical protein